MAISPQRLTIYLYSAHRAVIHSFLVSDSQCMLMCIISACFLSILHMSACHIDGTNKKRKVAKSRDIVLTVTELYWIKIQLQLNKKRLKLRWPLNNSSPVKQTWRQDKGRQIRMRECLEIEYHTALHWWLVHFLCVTSVLRVFSPLLLYCLDTLFCLKLHTFIWN